MFNYERHTHEQIQASLEAAFKLLLIQITPRAMTHAAAAGCFVEWKFDRQKEIYTLRNMFRVLVITSDKSDVVIVYEERPEQVGGPRAVSLKYTGPKEEPYDNERNE